MVLNHIFRYQYLYIQPFTFSFPYLTFLYIIILYYLFFQQIQFLFKLLNQIFLLVTNFQSF